MSPRAWHLQRRLLLLIGARARRRCSRRRRRARAAKLRRNHALRWHRVADARRPHAVESDRKQTSAFEFRPWHVIGVEPGRQRRLRARRIQEPEEKKKDETHPLSAPAGAEHRRANCWRETSNSSHDSPRMRWQRRHDTDAIEGIAVDPTTDIACTSSSPRNATRRIGSPTRKRGRGGVLCTRSRPTPNGKKELEPVDQARTTEGVLDGPEKLEAERPTNRA